jgi:hypothetical protein
MLQRLSPVATVWWAVTATLAGAAMGFDEPAAALFGIAPDSAKRGTAPEGSAGTDNETCRNMRIPAAVAAWGFDGGS